MKKLATRLLSTIRRTLLPVAALCLAALTVQAGPIPFTQNQFPVWYSVLPSPLSVTNTSEQQIIQVPIPPNVMGSQGFMQITSILDGDGIANAHVMRYYLGPVGSFTNGTAFATNTFTFSQATPVTTYLFPYVGAYSNFVYSTTTTNSASLPLVKQTVTVGTQTNGLFLTITGSNLGTTNYLTLDALIIQALAQ